MTSQNAMMPGKRKQEYYGIMELFLQMGLLLLFVTHRRGSASMGIQESAPHTKYQ